MYQPPFDVPRLSFEESLSTLHGALRFGIQPLLETVVDLLAELGGPDARFRSLQIAGTNGKTSTARYTAAILRGEGLKVALYTSPELVSYTERMEIDGAPVSEEAFAHGIAAAVEAARRVNARRRAAGERPYDVTEFDTLTAAACVIFAEAGVDVVVLECGMGGRWDATSAVGSVESVAVTGVGLDHMRILGDTLEAIAGEKAAIIRRGRGCVLGVGTATPASVEDVFLSRCASEGVEPVLLRPARPDDAAGEMHEGMPRAHEGLPHASYVITKHPRRLGFPLELSVTTPRGRYEELSCLKPSYQAANVACAVTLCERFLDRALDADRLYQSVVACPTPGRFSLLRPEPPVLVDACHNPQSVRAFLASLDELETTASVRPALLCAVLADKDVDGIVALLAPAFPRVYCTQTRSARALAAPELARRFEGASASVAGVFASVDDALARMGREAFVACGSITLAGELFARRNEFC
ncbi:folylpolyglutamate synthase/dihydrofolate synthase family protein [Olsenella sp. HMSC062G07]|uniref:bifunctional folylpolyglutamate synthase/dihydrofolate synthase n=1 Tax=Olsenella sp. HMSC062G07 TaxID=1739330 RepID=UPI0008A434AA|nr:Mur ligase family protein [Olsenella sp. HMSC062G07]OFK24355.1 bifunctional folylpolyglutamate synthase/dihydrofolate synthase [Olsenella sp. HMSC062G07]